MGPSLRTIWLYGKLRKQCGVDKVQIRGNTIRELIEGLSANFRKELEPRPDRPRLMCKIKDFDTEEKIFGTIPDDVTDIHVYPALMGSGGSAGAFFKIIIGALLIAASFIPFLAPISPFLFSMGMSLIMGGIMQLLVPVPKVDKNSANDLESSKYLGANQNTTKIGTPIGLIVGTILHYGQIISFNVDSIDVAV